MSHPLLAKMHDVLLKIKNAFKETPYKEKTNGIIRTIEMAYVKTANGTFESSASEESYGERLSAKKRRALETASLGINPRSLTAISSADGAKILQNIDNLILKYKNSSTQPKTFVGEMADALDVDMKDKSSKYANFECKNGNVVTIRISDHNATSSNLDINGQNNAISIVVTNKNNIGIINDGNAHIVEYYYNAIKLRKAEGKPLADIVGAIKQALYSGEFKDPTGLAERQEVNMPNSDENVLYSLRQKPEPEKKGTGYKVFVLGKDGKLYPPMVANPNGAATPVGVWLDADAAPVAGESKTGRPQVKQGGKGTQGGSGKLAYRPGWHLGVIPYAIQFNRKDAEGNKTLFPKNFVFAEVEYAADKDYQDEAHAEGINSNGKYQHSLAGLKHLPTDGYYMYRTNPNPETDPWVITGAMKVNRLLTRAEQADIVRKAGREPQQIQEGDIVTDDVVNSINQEIAAAPKFSLKVYHGTGADFTEFDFDHMGEGAGSQSFGWGGYVTSSKKIGKSYADLNRVRNLPEDIFDTENKKAAASYVQKLITQGYDKESAIQEVRSKYDGFLDNLNHDDTSRKNNGVAILNLKERIATLDEIEEGKLPLPTVSLYEVDIPDDNGSNYLEWEKKPSNEVATKIIEGIYGLDDKTLDDMAARDIVFRTLMYDYIKNADKKQMIPILVKTNGLTRNTVYDNGNVEDDMRFVYNRLSNWMGSPKAASKFLSSLGFTGIKYPAGTIYGGAKEGDVNYVIFKPEDMQIVEHEKFSVKSDVDNQGNPLNQDGTLKLEKIKSVDELTDEDFLHPTRNVELPSLPKKIADAIGTEGKPVVIKKNIFERNYMRHKDVTPELSKKIFKSALYNPDLYGQNQKKTRPYNWVLINTKDEKGNNRTVLLEVNPNKDNVEIVHWHFIDERGLKKIRKQVDREDGQLLILPSDKEEVGALSDPTVNLSAANIANPSETSKQNAEKFSLRLQDAINETDTDPTEAQKKSGNYKKGHVKFGGYDYTIENPKGSYRSGVDENGKEWKQKMNDTYGYIRGKFGKDGDHLDMFINDKADLDSWNGDVFVVDQVNQDGTFDEHKVMYGYGSLDEAKKAYLSNYEKGWTGLGNITPVSKADFDKWLDKSNRKLKPFADYADITSKTNMDTAPSSFEEFLEHPAVRYSIRNEKERAAAEDAYNFAQENRPDRYSRYAIVNMEKPGAVPQYLEKKAVADNWRRYYNKLKWGNYKLFDLDKPFEDNVKNLVGKFPETFRKKNDTTLSKINELTADYNKRKEEYDAMSNSIQELLNGLMKQGRSLAEAESVIRDWGLYKEMDSKYQNLMGIRKQLNELRSGKVADDERFSLIGKKGAEALDHAEEVSTRLDNLNVARQMEGAKKDAKAIKMATGWERGADGKWRYEIADSKLNDMMDVDGKGKMVKRHKEDMLWTSGKLGEVVVAPELFKAYPKLKDVRLETDSIMNNLPSNGEYNAKTNTITIHADELKYLDSILNHEIQHAIQHIEGFARGGNPEYLQWRIEAAKKEWRARAWADALRDKAEEMGEHYNQVEVEKALIDEYKEMGMDNDEWMPDKETRIKGFNYFARGYADRSFDDDIRAFRLNESTRSDYNSYVEYTKLGGEVEARNVQSRMNMSPEERRKTLAEETEDVARKDQIFLYGDSVSMMGSRAFNEAINSSDNIRFSLKEEKEKIVSDAKANGTYMTAPNGEKTKLNAEQWVTVRTTNFKNWFGDWENDPENASKVVDENGEPMVVWHGRSAEFNTFEKKKGVRFIMGLEDKVKAEGFFFSPNKGLAEEFASNSSRHRGGKANVIPCFLNIRKPMDLTREDYDRIYEDVTGWDYIVGMDTQDNLWGIMDEEGMADKIKEKGYDGAIFVEEVDDSYEPTKISYCALDANQIKSAENNNGDFSADNNDIRFSLKSMMEKPEGWKQANKKAIHIAEAIERDPKFSLKNLDGTLIKAGTYFSGGGLVEEGLKGIIDPVVAVEYDEKISGVYRNNFGNHIVTADVRDVDPKELVGKIDGEVEYFHASPVCKNYSLAKNNHEELELDKETAASTAEFISKVRPKVVTIENVKGYKDSEAMKTITDALDEAGYKWDADVYNAADYGGYTNRERLIVRAVRDGELPANPEKQKRKSGWYEAVEDIMPTLTEKKNGVAPWMDERLKADGIDWRHIDKPLYVMGSGYANGTVPHAFADELLPTLRTKSGDVIVMPDGKVYRAMGRVLARVSGVSDDYQMPASEALSHTIIGNGIPTQLTENVIAPLVRDVLHPAVEEKASLKDADRKQTQLDIILKTNPMLDDYHTGIRKVEDIKTLGESVEEARSEAEKYGDDEWSAYPDITNDMLQNALETGEITIYSSKPIKNGVFVTPSYMQASDYAGGGNVYEKTVPLTDVAWINTDEGQYAKVDGERYSLKEVNDKFNDRLAQLIENPNQKDRVLHLGRSSQFLIDGGIADAEIELDFDKFVRKSSEKYKNNHPFSAGDIKDLPKAIAYPVAVFNSTTKKDHVVMTELNHDGKNFIVAIRATEQNRKNKVVLEVNQITSLYPKGERGIIYWINNNKLSNVDKEKALHFIEALQPHAGTLTSEELSSAANIVRNFVNPKQNDGNLQKTEKYSLRVDRYRDELNQWKKDNNLPKDAERPQLPVREPNDRFGFT